MKWFVRILFKLFFRVEVKGLEHFKKIAESGKPALIIANHISLLDGPLLGLFLTGKITFMIHVGYTKKWYEKFLLSYVNYLAVDLQSPFAVKNMIKELKKGNHCMIFPEGRISTTGALMKVYEGTAMLADKTQAQILPVFIQGSQFSKLSYLDGTRFAFVKQQWFPKITLTILPPEKIQKPAHLTGKAKHKFLQNAIYQIMRDSAFYGSYEDKSLFKALVDAKNRYSAKDTCVEDINRVELNRKKMLLGSYILGKKLQSQLQDQQRVGVLLPNVSGIAITFFSLQAYGYVPAMLNFTAGLGPLRSACETAELKTIITSHKFVEVFKIEETVKSLSEQVTFIYLEDIRETIGLADKLKALITSPSSMKGYHKKPDDEAVVLFTSGTEGAPKGVILSHSNVNANIEQISAMLTLLPNEQILNALPTFHSFGLTAGLLWPILKGGKVFLYPSPLHYRIVPEIIYRLNAKIFFGTDTFFSGYAKKAHQYDFYSIRVLVAGAEKLRPETRQIYADKFHIPIYEGYGITETSPVLSVNIPLACKNGSVGQFVPGIKYRIEDVAGIDDGGRLFVTGPNIMKGYLMPDKPGIVQPPLDGWHDTGDIVDVDDEGYVTIKGRVKRFAKIAGEMISLTAVETYINKSSPEGHHVVVSIPDERKGEQLVLITNDDSLSRQTVRQAATVAQVSDLMVPKTVILIADIPVFGTGKTNYPEIQKIAEGYFNSPDDPDPASEQAHNI